MLVVAFLSGLVAGAAAIVVWLDRVATRIEREQAKPLRMPSPTARCAPEMQTPATRVQVVGARETYSHPNADQILLQRQLWTPGGNG